TRPPKAIRPSFSFFHPLVQNRPQENRQDAKSAKDRQVNHDVSLRPGKEQLGSVGPNRLGEPADGSAKQEIFAPKPL
ncbi:MAG TPA: hypothetical protein VM658_06645, partial [bacterium]|nr:hypothetical protein [bacterium]